MEPPIRTLPCPVLLGISVRSCIVKEVPLAFCLPHDQLHPTVSTSSTLPFAGENLTANPSTTDNDAAYILKPLFVFPNLCVRIGGKFRLKVSVVNLVQ